MDQYYDMVSFIMDVLDSDSIIVSDDLVGNYDVVSIRIHIGEQSSGYYYHNDDAYLSAIRLYWSRV